MITDRFRSWSMTHPGARRSYNEDSLVERAEIGLWAVADGAGGHASGEVASAMIAEALNKMPAGLGAAALLSEVRLRIGATHDALCQEGTRRGDVQIASTIVVMLVRDQHFACLWAGDSRAYLLRGGMLSQITRDHSLVQELVESGAITAEEAENHPRGNIITRAVGADIDHFEMDKVTGRLHIGDRLLLCSDGLCKTLPETEIIALLAAPEPAEMLVAAALARQANDNVTAVAVEILQ